MVEASDSGDEGSRGARVLKLRTDLGLTGVEFADYLNDVAEQLGFDRYWTPPKVTNTEKNKRDIQLADLAVFESADPARRSWFWFAYGRAKPDVQRRGTAHATRSGAAPLTRREPQRPVVPRQAGRGKG